MVTCQTGDKLTGKQCVMKVRGHLGNVTSMAFHPDGMLLATGCANGILNIWSLQVILFFNMINVDTAIIPVEPQYSLNTLHVHYICVV